MGLPINVTLGLDKLVETVANAIGLTALGKIMNAKGEAKAEALLSKKRAETDAEVEILKIRGQEKIDQYVMARNKQKADNVGDILSRAGQQFTPDEKVSTEPVDKDWMNRFLDIAEDVSDNEMQELWARVLAGEIKHPKSYSLRTLDVLKNISKEEAEIIVKSASYVYELNYICIEDFALNLNDKIVLDDIGIVCGEDLIHTITLNGKKHYFPINHNLVINVYADTSIKFDIHCVKLTRAGSEIMRLVQDIDYQKYLQSLAFKIKNQGATKITYNKIIRWEGTQYTYLDPEIEI
jgi:hypothetical protein